MQPITKEEFILVGLAEKCLHLSSELQKGLKSSGGFRKALKVRWKKSSNQKRVEELSALEQAMQTQLTTNSCARTQAIQAEQEDSFGDLGAQIKDFTKQIQSGHTELKDLIRSEATRSREHTIAEAERIRNHFTTQFSRTTDRLKQDANKLEYSARMKKLLDSLVFPEMNARKNTSSIKAYRSTFEWVFDDKKERAWDSFPSLTSQEQKMYWISGKPGSGKSTLMKFLIGHSRTTELLCQWSPHPFIISYFLWRSGSPNQRSTKCLLSSLAYQILDSTVETLQFPADSLIWRKSFIDDWSLQELEEVLLQLLKILARPICLFLDGLDELDPTENPFDLMDLIGRLSQETKIKLCLASRPERAYHQRYHVLPTMRLQDLTKPDMSHYVRQELESYMSTSQLSNDPKKCEDLVQTII